MLIAFALTFYLVANYADFSPESGPLIIVVVAFALIGWRFVTSIHRHVVHFKTPDQMYIWRSPAIDFDAETEAAHAVREHARNRNIFRSA